MKQLSKRSMGNGQTADSGQIHSYSMREKVPFLYPQYLKFLLFGQLGEISVNEMP